MVELWYIFSEETNKFTQHQRLLLPCPRMHSAHLRNLAFETQMEKQKSENK